MSSDLLEIFIQTKWPLLSIDAAKYPALFKSHDFYESEPPMLRRDKFVFLEDIFVCLALRIHSKITNIM